MSEHVDAVYLKIMTDHLQKVRNYLHGKSKQDFLDNDLLADAVLINLIQISEAANKLSEEFKEKKPINELV